MGEVEENQVIMSSVLNRNVLEERLLVDSFMKQNGCVGLTIPVIQCLFIKYSSSND